MKGLEREELRVGARGCGSGEKEGGESGERWKDGEMGVVGRE